MTTGTEIVASRNELGRKPSIAYANDPPTKITGAPTKQTIAAARNDTPFSQGGTSFDGAHAATANRKRKRWRGA